jgi:hypothetical protein
MEAGPDDLILGRRVPVLSYRGTKRGCPGGKGDTEGPIEIEEGGATGRARSRGYSG